MPIYEYKCPKCDKTFKIEHSMTEHPEPACTECVVKLQRVFRVGGLSFKGNGWGSDR